MYFDSRRESQRNPKRLNFCDVGYDSACGTLPILRKMKKEVLPMSDFELLMIVFTVLSLLIMAYNGRK